MISTAAINDVMDETYYCFGSFEIVYHQHNTQCCILLRDLYGPLEAGHAKKAGGSYGTCDRCDSIFYLKPLPKETNKLASLPAMVYDQKRLCMCLECATEHCTTARQHLDRLCKVEASFMLPNLLAPVVGGYMSLLPSDVASMVGTYWSQAQSVWQAKERHTARGSIGAIQKPMVRKIPRPLPMVVRAHRRRRLNVEEEKEEEQEEEEEEEEPDEKKIAEGLAQGIR